MKQPHALDGLCGSIRLVVVPAEEMIQLAFREELRQKGIMKYNGGKTEFMYRGLLDGVDMAMMVHGMTKGSSVNEDGDTNLDFSAQLGMNGCIAKNIRYKGKSAHAGGAPHMGVNAEYAAMLGLQACNNLRETFQEKDTIRFHIIISDLPPPESHGKHSVSWLVSMRHYRQNTQRLYMLFPLRSVRYFSRYFYVIWNFSKISHYKKECALAHSRASRGRLRQSTSSRECASLAR